MVDMISATPPHLYDLPIDVVEQLDHAVYSAHDPHRVFEIILNIALRELGAAYGSLRLVNRRTRQLERKAFKVSHENGRTMPDHGRDLPLDGNHIVSHVAQTKEPLLITNLKESTWGPHYHPLDEKTVMLTELAVPLLSNDQRVTIGVLNIESPEVNAFTLEDIAFLQALSRRALLAIQRVQLSEAIQKVSQAVLEFDLESLLKHTVHELCTLMQVPVCSIWMWDKQKHRLVLSKTTGRNQNDRRAPDKTLSKQSFVGQVVESKMPAYSANVQEDPHFVYTDLAKSEGWLSSMAVPIMSGKQEVLGVTSVYSVEEQREFTSFDFQLAETFSNQVAIALKQFHLLAYKEKQIRLRSATQRISNASVHADDKEKVLDAIVNEASQLVDSSGAVLYLINKPMKQVVAATTTESCQPLKGMRSSLQSSLSGWVAKHNQSIICTKDDPRIDQTLAQKLAIQEILAVPLAQNDQVLGTLVVLKDKHAKESFSGEDQTILSDLASQAATTIYRLNESELTQRRAEQRRVVNDILAESSTSNDIDELLHNATIKISEVLDYKVDIALIEQQTIRIHTTAYRGRVLSKDEICNKRELTFDEGIVGKVARTEKIVNVPDVTKEPDYFPCFMKTKSEIGVPMHSPKGVVGILNVESDTYGAFSEEDGELFSTIASGLAMALENARRLKSLKAMHQISSLLGEATSLQAMKQIAVETFVDLFSAQASTLFMYDSAEQTLCLEASYRVPSTMKKRIQSLGIGQSVAGKVFETGEPLYIANMLTDPRADGTTLPEDNIRAIIGVPIRSQDLTLGVLCLLTQEDRHYSQQDIDTLQAISNNVGITINRAQMSRDYERLYKGSRDAIVTMRLDGTVLNINPQTTKLLGYSAEEILDQSIHKFLVNDERATVSKRFQQIAQNEPVSPQEFLLRKKNGSTLLIESNPTAIIDERGNAQIQANWRDVTERKEQEEKILQQNKQLNGLLKLSRLILNIGTTTELIHEAEEQIKHLVASETCVIKHYFSHRPVSRQLGRAPFLSQDWETYAQGVIQQVISTNTPRIENYLPRDPTYLSKEGEYHLMVLPMELDNKVIGYISLTRKEGPYTQGPFTLEDKQFTESIANTLTLAIGYLQNIETAKNQAAAKSVLENMYFVAAFLTHKMSGTLGAISMTARELKRHLKQRDETTTDFLTVLEDTSKTAGVVVEKLREMSKPMDAYREIIAVRPVVEKEIDKSQVPSSIKVVCHSLDLPPVLADSELLEEVFGGIIRNAIDAMPTGGKLTISGRVATDNSTIIIDFTDSGRGVAPHLREKVFSPFFTTKNDGQGMGIGLWVSQLYIQSLKGDIFMRSTPGRGTTFSVQIPFDKSATAPIVKPAPIVLEATIDFEEIEAPNCHVLIVEDDDLWLRTLTTSLTSRELTYETATDLISAEVKLHSSAFDIFIVDVRLVDYDTSNYEGLTFVQKLLDHSPNAKVVILSAWHESFQTAQRRFGHLSNIIIHKKNSELNLETILSKLLSNEGIDS